MRTLAATAITAVVLAAVGGGALAEEVVIDDGDGVGLITATGPIAFGSVCLGSTSSTTRLVAAKRTTDASGNNWRNNGSLVASATTTGVGAAATVTDPSITLTGNWQRSADGTLSVETAEVRLAVTAAQAPGPQSGTLAVKLSGLQQTMSNVTLERVATVAWTLTAVSCNTAPTISVNDVSLEGNVLGGRTLAFADIGSAGDAEDPTAPAVSCAPALGTVLPRGRTTVTCTARDSAGLTTTDSGTVTVVDSIAPVITGTPSSTTVEATSGSGATHTFLTPTAHDTVSGTVTVSCVPSSGSTFALGATTVACSAADGAGNQASTSFQVNVADTTQPVLSQPADVTVEATSAGGATVTYPSPTATDAVAGTIPVTCETASGSRFPLGDTTVECRAADGAGNEGTTSFVVHVVDTTAPEIEALADITVEATSASGASVLFEASATDAVDATPTVLCTPASGSTFGLGTHTVRCTATDDAGNSARDSFSVTVEDTTAPLLEQLADLVVEGNTYGGALTAYTAPRATDAVDPDPVVECDPLESAFFRLGTTTVTCTARDAAGNAVEDAFDVTVVDTTAPILSDVPTDEQVEGNTTGGAVVTYAAPTATDTVDITPTVSCTPPSGSTIPLGKTTVTCSATDDSGNTSVASSFDVTVVDTTAPTITHVSTLPKANAGGWNSSDVTVTWSCSDIVGVVEATVTQVLADEGANQSATGTCVDTSGNHASDTRTGIDIDESAPSALLSITAGTLGENGWYRSDVTVGTSGTDTLSGPPTCSADQSLVTDSVGSVFTGSCTNLAGLTTDAAPLTVKRDTLAPTITVGVPTGTLGVNGWYVTSVTSPFIAEDATSGVNGPTSFGIGSGSAEGLGVSIASGPVDDHAGNRAPSISAGPFSIDLSDPTGTTFDGGPAPGSSHYFGSVPTAPTCRAVDAVSGLASCVVTGYSTSVGTHTMTATATDNAGRTATVTRSYTVLGWTLKGLYQPVDMAGVLNTVKNGSTVPLKFELFAGASEKTSVDDVKSLKYAETTCSTTSAMDDIETVATGGTTLRYDSTAGQYVYNWKTPSTAGKCYRLTVTAADGGALVAYFKLK